MKSSKEITKELLEYTKENKVIAVCENILVNDFEELNEEETIKVIKNLESTLDSFTNDYLLLKYKCFIDSFISNEIDELTISKKGIRDVILKSKRSCL